MGRYGLPGVGWHQAFDVLKVFGVAGRHGQPGGKGNRGNLRVFGRYGLPLPGAGRHQDGIVLGGRSIKINLETAVAGLEIPSNPMLERVCVDLRHSPYG